MYEIIKSIHIISVICWMAGLLYLPRIFVYHCENMKNSSVTSIFCIMERKLINFIMNPAMIATLLTGGHLASKFSLDLWLVSKIFFVVLLLIFHFFCFYFVKKFSKGVCNYSSKFFRLVNEIPALLMIVIVVLVVTKFF